ncbi:hypothetical protein THIOSC15_2100005 [uncultured Thiomicrorhabdus sp.]
MGEFINGVWVVEIIFGNLDCYLEFDKVAHGISVVTYQQATNAGRPPGGGFVGS